jgi:hypothetical protein
MIATLPANWRIARLKPASIPSPSAICNLRSSPRLRWQRAFFQASGLARYLQHIIPCCPNVFFVAYPPSTRIRIGSADRF